MDKKKEPNAVIKFFSYKYRHDGVLAETDYFQKFLPYLIRRRSEAMILMDVEIDMTKANEYMKNYNANNTDVSLKLTPFVLVLAACQRLGVEKPKMNRFISGKRIYDRNAIEICYVIKTMMDESGQEVVVKERFSTEDRLAQVLKKVSKTKTKSKGKDAGSIDRAMKTLSKMPRFIISSTFMFLRVLNWFNVLPKSIMKSDALYSSAFITNVGSLGSMAPYHHLFDMGTTSVFIAMGMVRKVNGLADDGSVFKKDVLDIRFSIDDRIADGFYYVRAIDLFKKYLENPELME